MSEQANSQLLRGPLERGPWAFRLAKWLIHHRLRGGHRLTDFAERMGWLNCVVRYRLGGEVELDVPLFRRENRWDLSDLLLYEAAFVDSFCAAVARLSPPVRLVDCGADIGLFSALVAARCPSVDGIWAFEPNPVSFRYLQTNIDLLRRGMRRFGLASPCAIGDFAGRGRLCNSSTDPLSEHARFLARDPTGPVEVVRIDDLEWQSRSSVALKLDLEGGEFAALRGAQQVLREASSWVVAFEAHVDVCREHRVEPCELVRWLSRLRPVEATVGERPQFTLDTSLPYFQQVPEPRVSNIIVTAL